MPTPRYANKSAARWVTPVMAHTDALNGKTARCSRSNVPWKNLRAQWSSLTRLSLGHSEMNSHPLQRQQTYPTLAWSHRDDPANVWSEATPYDEGQHSRSTYSSCRSLKPQTNDEATEQSVYETTRYMSPSSKSSSSCACRRLIAAASIGPEDMITLNIPSTVPSSVEQYSNPPSYDPRVTPSRVISQNSHNPSLSRQSYTPSVLQSTHAPWASYYTQAPTMSHYSHPPTVSREESTMTAPAASGMRSQQASEKSHEPDKPLASTLLSAPPQALEIDAEQLREEAQISTALGAGSGCPCERHDRKMRSFARWYLTRQDDLEHKRSTRKPSHKPFPEFREAFPRNDDDYNAITKTRAARVRRVHRDCLDTWVPYAARHPRAAELRKAVSVLTSQKRPNRLETSESRRSLPVTTASFQPSVRAAEIQQEPMVALWTPSSSVQMSTAQPTHNMPVPLAPATAATVEAAMGPPPPLVRTMTVLPEPLVTPPNLQPQYLWKAPPPAPYTYGPYSTLLRNNIPPALVSPLGAYPPYMPPPYPYLPPYHVPQPYVHPCPVTSYMPHQYYQPSPARKIEGKLTITARKGHDRGYQKGPARHYESPPRHPEIMRRFDDTTSQHEDKVQGHRDSPRAENKHLVEKRKRSTPSTTESKRSSRDDDEEKSSRKESAQEDTAETIKLKKKEQMLDQKAAAKATTKPTGASPKKLSRPVKKEIDRSAKKESDRPAKKEVEEKKPSAKKESEQKQQSVRKLSPREGKPAETARKVTKAANGATPKTPHDTKQSQKQEILKSEDAAKVVAAQFDTEKSEPSASPRQQSPRDALPEQIEVPMMSSPPSLMSPKDLRSEQLQGMSFAYPTTVREQSPPRCQSSDGPPSIEIELPCAQDASKQPLISITQEDKPDEPILIWQNRAPVESPTESSSDSEEQSLLLPLVCGNVPVFRRRHRSCSPRR